MTLQEVHTLLPLIVLGGGTVLLFLAAAFTRKHALVAILAAAVIICACLALYAPATKTGTAVGTILDLDRYAVFFIGLILAAALFTIPFAWTCLRNAGTRPEEFYVLLTIAAAGGAVLAAAVHFAALFLGIEILSISLYGMIAYTRAEKRSIEAGIKYLILAAVSSSFLLLGMALIYAELGTMRFADMPARSAALPSGTSLVLLGGWALMLVGVGFKLAIVPFHWWTPDVYEGAPAPVTGFIATASKGAVFAAALRYFDPLTADGQTTLYVLFNTVAVASMFGGNLLALHQKNVKRLLAYSSIAHLGYLLVSFQAGGSAGAASAGFYLAAYFATTLGAFGVVEVMRGEDGADTLEGWRGLFWRRPALAAIFTLMLLSLAGLPLTAGFFAKLFVVGAGIRASLWVLIAALVVSSVIGLFYYLRVIAVMADSRKVERSSAPLEVPLVSAATLVILTAALVFLGLWPEPLIRFLSTM